MTFKKLLNNKLVIIAGLIVLVAIFLFSYKVFFAPKNMWVCKNGVWEMDGKPKTPRPVAPCEKTGHVSGSEETQDSAVGAFYDWFFAYGDAMESSVYMESPTLTDDFKNSISNSKTNPFTCFDEQPSNYRAVSSDIQGETGITKLELTFTFGKRIIPVQIVNESGMWKISGIDCSKVQVQKGLGYEIDGETKITIFYPNSEIMPYADCTSAFPLERTVSEDITAELLIQELFKGPSEEERMRGYSSMLVESPDKNLLGVRVVGRVAYVNIADINKVYGNSGETCGWSSFISQVTKTLTNTGEIDQVIIGIAGDARAFYEGINVGCNIENNNCDFTPYNTSE